MEYVTLPVRARKGLHVRYAFKRLPADRPRSLDQWIELLPSAVDEFLTVEDGKWTVSLGESLGMARPVRIDMGMVPIFDLTIGDRPPRDLRELLVSLFGGEALMQVHVFTLARAVDRLRRRADPADDSVTLTGRTTSGETIEAEFSPDDLADLESGRRRFIVGSNTRSLDEQLGALAAWQERLPEMLEENA